MEEVVVDLKTLRHWRCVERGYGERDNRDEHTIAESSR